MTDRTVFVHADLDGVTHVVGRLHARFRKGRQTASFAYEPSWLDSPSRYPLEPALDLVEVPHHTTGDHPLFGSIGDSAPDRWGRNLMRRAERKRANAEGRQPRALNEIDFLVGVSDETRAGALRFADQPGGPYLATPDVAPPVPPLVELPRLLAASDRVATDEDTESDLRLLLAPGSSLGGARPKASVRDKDGSLLIAKFPHPTDDRNVSGWEALALRLARQAGIDAADGRLETVAGRSVLLLSRFDRRAAVRIPFLSAMSLLGASDNEPHSYLEIADGLRRYGGAPASDLPQLWRRILFSVLISNTDDHLRNHGLLWAGPQGWRLSPAYDLNPTPADVRPRILSLAIDEEDATASLDLVLSVAEQFGVKAAAAVAIVGEVGRAVARWRDEAVALGIPAKECERMQSAFEHSDLRKAIATS